MTFDHFTKAAHSATYHRFSCAQYHPGFALTYSEPADCYTLLNW